jgi:NADH-quinone oxidoreductase subunit I/NAD(P)H-quinone oxidoreductase subunit I
MADKKKSRREREFGMTAYILRPMLVTAKQTFKSTIHRPNTVQYPWEKIILPDVFRGRPGLIFDKCIGCGICMRMCPTRASIWSRSMT